MHDWTTKGSSIPNARAYSYSIEARYVLNPALGLFIKKKNNRFRTMYICLKLIRSRILKIMNGREANHFYFYISLKP